MSETTSDLGAEDAAPPDRAARATIWAALLGALAMTSCCILPLTLVSLGVSGVFIGKLGLLYQYHWYFLAFAGAALAYGFWKAYRPVDEAACESGTCARPLNRTFMRVTLWVALAITVIAVAFPYAAPLLLSY